MTWATSLRLVVIIRRVLALFDELGDRRSMANLLFNLGDIANKEGDYATSRNLLEESLSIRNELGDERGRAFVLIALADIALAQNDAEGATTLLRESLRFFHEAGEKRNLTYIFLGLASAAKSGNASVAARLLGAVDALCAAIGFVLPPSDRPDYERDMAAARQMLGEAVFQQEYDDGLALPLEEAVIFAMTFSVHPMS